MDGETNEARRELAERVEGLVRGRGWTMDDLVRRARVEPLELAALLDGTEEVGISLILRLAGALDVETDALIGGIEWVPGPDGGEYRVDGA
jgi:transcriptional regulator with XRE-family HTH domain